MRRRVDGALSTDRIETAPMLGVWGCLGPTVARLIRHKPDLAGRLSLASPNATHCVAALLHYRLSGPVDFDLLAHELATRDARNMLAEAVPDTHPKLYGLLGRLGPVTKSLSFYQELNAELGQPAADILMDAPSISRHTIRIARQVSADPVLLAARRAIGEDDLLLRHLTSVFGLLRTLGIANRIERLPSGSGIQAIVRRIKMDFRCAQAPKVPFELPPGWQPVRDVGHLIGIGEKLQNCLSHWAGDGARHVGSYLSGASVFLTHTDVVTVLVSLDRLGPKLWSVGEFDSSSSAESDDEIKQRMVNELRGCLAQTGDVLLAVDPFHAIIELGWRARG
jgi:hypothetical protein